MLLQAFRSREWQVVDAAFASQHQPNLWPTDRLCRLGRMDGCPTKTICASSVPNHARRVRGQLAVMHFVVDQSQLPSLSALVGNFSGLPVANGYSSLSQWLPFCEPWHAQSVMCFSGWICTMICLLFDFDGSVSGETSQHTEQDLFVHCLSGSSHTCYSR